MLTISSPPSEHSEIQDSPLLVLIGDDIDESRIILRDMVISQGHACIVAASGTEVIEQVLTKHPDLVLLDLLMPGMNGFEVASILRQRIKDRWLPIIVMSALEGENHFIFALQRGADDYLVRPINPELLSAKLLHYRRVLAEQRQVGRMKEEFLATVSHELRTPLTSIVGALGLLSAGAAGTLPDEAQRLLEIARRNGGRLSDLIDDVLDLTKLEGNRMPMYRQLTILNQLLHEAIEQNKGYADNYGVSLELDCLAKEAVALVDRSRALQVMDNLLSNAIKHTRKGSAVRVVLKGNVDAWQIDVIDQGQGIDVVFRERLFEKFAQADSSDNRKLGGTGLGLYISRMLVERMGGSIEVQSMKGFGSTFSVKFPIQHQGMGWLLCLAEDKKQLDKIEAWLSPMISVEKSIDLKGAKDLIARLGSPSIILADPQGQGSADFFCDQLRAITQSTAILLIGDSIDQAFSDAQKLTWAGPNSQGTMRKIEEYVGAQLLRRRQTPETSR